MKPSLQLKGIYLGAAASLIAFTLVFAAGKSFQSPPVTSTAIPDGLAIPPAGTPANRGYTLFMRNCAHCHGADARGGEGPDLHGVTKSDERIASLIKNGRPGEMPKFGSKLKDDEVHALIAFLRTLRG